MAFKGTLKKIKPETKFSFSIFSKVLKKCFYLKPFIRNMINFFTLHTKMTTKTFKHFYVLIKISVMSRNWPFRVRCSV